jgi:hypothetical protein
MGGPVRDGREHIDSWNLLGEPSIQSPRGYVRRVNV